jgi:hypothetical protein
VTRRSGTPCASAESREAAWGWPGCPRRQQRVTASIDKSVEQDQARTRIRLKDGRVLERFVAHVIGSVENPLSDAGLQEKFSDLLKPKRVQAWSLHGGGYSEPAKTVYNACHKESPWRAR